MKSSTRQVDGVTIVDLSGRITLGEGSTMLRDIVRDLIAKGQKKILLNLGDVTYIDSSGIGELVSAFTTVRNGGGELKLLNLTKKVHDLLQITKLYTVFDIKDDEAVAHPVVHEVVLLTTGQINKSVQKTQRAHHVGAFCFWWRGRIRFPRLLHRFENQRLASLAIWHLHQQRCQEHQHHSDHLHRS